MSIPIIQLPAGTSLTKMINLPLTGGWLGNVSVCLIAPADISVAELLFIYPHNPDGKLRYRRTGGTLAGNYQNWTLPADRKMLKWLVQDECAMKITYTSTVEISVAVETTRLVKPYAYPAIPATAYPTEVAVNIGPSINGKVYWKSSA